MSCSSFVFLLSRLFTSHAHHQGYFTEFCLVINCNRFFQNTMWTSFDVINTNIFLLKRYSSTLSSDKYRQVNMSSILRYRVKWLNFASDYAFADTFSGIEKSTSHVSNIKSTAIWHPSSLIRNWWIRLRMAFFFHAVRYVWISLNNFSHR